mgnify:CR=1 FL=1
MASQGMSNAVSQVTKGEERRTEILAAARRVLLADGYHELSLRQIASSLGISVGNLQYYFPNKDDLVEAVITREINQSLELAVDAEWDSTDPQSSTFKLVHAILTHHASEAGQFYALAEGLALHKQRFADLKSQGYIAVFEQVASLIEVQRPDLEANNRQGLAAVLVALMDGASLQVQFGKAAASTKAINRLSEDIAQAIFQLIRNWE